MVRIMINISNLSQVLLYYDQVKVYRAVGAEGVFTEITDVDTRVSIIPERTQYFYADADGDASAHYYKTAYFNSVTLDEGDPSSARQGGTEAEKIGYTFNNYTAPPNEWGELITADDLRYTYMFGIEAVANDSAESEFTDEQFKFQIDSAVGDFEDYLTIDIRKRKYVTNPENLVQSRRWREGVDYTHEEYDYDFSPEHWKQYGFIQLRHFPLLSVERFTMFSPVKGEVLDLLDWVRMKKSIGQLHAYPKQGSAFGPYNIYGMPWTLQGRSYPGGYEIDYTTGYKTSDFVPEGMRNIIAMWATIKALDTIGDGLLAGFSSQSVSLDGLSESFSSTQSATSAYFGARIQSYIKQIDSWLQKNRYKHGAIPMSFVGVN